MQIKTTMRYHLTPVQMAIINKSKTTSVSKDVEKGEPFCITMGMQIGAATVENSMEVPQKIKNESTFWPSNPTFGNISKGTQNTNLKEHKHPYVRCSIIYNYQDMETAQVSISKEWLKLWDIHTMDYYLAMKKKKNFTLCYSMDGPGDYYAKWNKPVRERQIP